MTSSLGSRLLALLVSAWLCASCVSFGYENSGMDPMVEVDWNEVIRQAAEAGAKQRDQLEATSSLGVVDETDPVYASTRATFDEVAETRRILLMNFGRRSGSDSFYRVRSEISGTPPRIVILPSDSPVSTTYPDKTIVITRGLAEGLSDDPKVNHWTVRAVAAHELVHHYDGHAVFNWLATEGQKSVPLKQFLAKASPVTRNLPFLSVDVKYNPSQTYEDAGQHAPLFEFVADYWAYYILKEMKAPRGSMSSTLFAIEQAAQGGDDRTRTLQLVNLIGKRARCMTLLDSNAALDASLRVHTLGESHAVASREMIERILASSLSKSKDPTEQHLLSVMIQRIKAHPEQELKPVIVEDAYWGCAIAAIQVEQAENPPAEWRRPFEVREPREVADAFSRLVMTDERPERTAALKYFDSIDGIPLLEAGIQFAAIRPDLRPNILLSGSQYLGFESGNHHVRLRLGDSGYKPVDQSFAMTATRAGRPLPFSLCGPEKIGVADPECDGSHLTSPGLKMAKTVDVYFRGTAVPLPAERIVRFTLDSAIDEEEKKDNVVEIGTGMMPNLVVGEYRFGETEDTAMVRNIGFAPIAAPFELVAFGGEERIALSQCNAGEPTTESCAGVWFREPIPPEGSQRVAFRRASGKYERIERLWVDGCGEGNLQIPPPQCAIEETNEGDNIYSR